MMRLLAILLLFLAGPAIADEVRLFELKHRTAEEMMPIVRPLLDEGAGLSGSGYNLIVRSGEANLKQIADAIERLDRAARQLLVSVRQGGGDQGRFDGFRVEPDGRRVRVWSTTGDSSDRSIQRLRMLEGNWARIAAGEEVPVGSRRMTTSPYGTSVEESVEYKEATTGFEVRPVVSGEQVRIDVRPFSTRPSVQGGGRFDTQSLSTTVTAPLGEWVLIGGGDETIRRSERGIVYSTRELDADTRQVWLKVETVQ